MPPCSSRHWLEIHGWATSCVRGSLYVRGHLPLVGKQGLLCKATHSHTVDTHGHNTSHSQQESGSESRACHHGGCFQGVVVASPIIPVDAIGVRGVVADVLVAVQVR